MKKIFFAIGFLMASLAARAQDSTQHNPLTISGYAEIYYGYDFNKPADHNRPSFIYSHNRHNEVNLNLAYIKAAYDNGSVRANVALMAGTYANANLAAEPGVLKNVYEANAGVKLSKTANLWLDAGVFGSHIGFESAVGKNNWMLTRNIVSENTPYFETGAKITYVTPDNKLTLTGLYLNGWQRINRTDGNNKPAGGIEVYYSPSSKVSLNYSNFLGTEGPDSAGVRRFYNNFYGIFQLNKALGLTVGFDYGIQQKAKGSSSYNYILAPVAVMRYQIAESWAAAARVEYYQDKQGMIIATNTPYGFQTKGYALNVDYAPVKNAVIRLEGKLFDSNDAIFIRDDQPVSNNPLITASFAVSF